MTLNHIFRRKIKAIFSPISYFNSDNDKNNSGKPEGPPDLEEVWKDFSSKIIKLGERKGNGSNNGGGKKPEFDLSKLQGSNKLYLLVFLIVVLIWLGSGFYIVQEGEKSVVTQFGRYHATRDAGWSWRWPYPIQNNEIVKATQLKSIAVGDDSIIQATGLKTSGMLTADGNIVEIKFDVQYRLKVSSNGVRDYVFETQNPDAAVRQVAESAVREVVGKMKLDEALTARDQIAPRVRQISQDMLDQYKTGIEVAAINMQEAGVRPPEAVQAAFDDVLKAEQERERLINEAKAYENNKVPQAQGVASKLVEEAAAYSARVIARAEGDAKRFSMIAQEYKKSPKVVKDRIYIDTMQDIYQNVNKVIVDSKQNSNLLFLPLEQLLKNNAIKYEGTNNSSIQNNNNIEQYVPKNSTAKDSGTNNFERDRSRENR